MIKSAVIDATVKEVTPFNVGDTVSVTYDILEDTIVQKKTAKAQSNEVRSQTFTGIVLAIKNSENTKTFTVRKISYGVGVEKIFPLYSPLITDIKVDKKGEVRQSKIYYMRGRVGKLAMRVKEPQK